MRRRRCGRSQRSHERSTAHLRLCRGSTRVRRGGESRSFHAGSGKLRWVLPRWNRVLRGRCPPNHPRYHETPSEHAHVRYGPTHSAFGRTSCLGIETRTNGCGRDSDRRRRHRRTFCTRADWTRPKSCTQHCCHPCHCKGTGKGTCDVRQRSEQCDCTHGHQRRSKRRRRWIGHQQVERSGRYGSHSASHCGCCAWRGPAQPPPRGSSLFLCEAKCEGGTTLSPSFGSNPPRRCHTGSACR
mmetsp:Transcript_9568/g.58271  ORF Transcript_9568/g.58271 Transcript_9568/m.58271 type:complete len:241 (+) Transcript_9568:420-1142(+)